MSAPLYLPPAEPPFLAVLVAEEAMIAAEGLFTVEGGYYAHPFDAERARRRAAERRVGGAARVAEVAR